MNIKQGWRNTAILSNTLVYWKSPDNLPFRSRIIEDVYKRQHLGYFQTYPLFCVRGEHLRKISVQAKDLLNPKKMAISLILRYMIVTLAINYIHLRS